MLEAGDEPEGTKDSNAEESNLDQETENTNSLPEDQVQEEGVAECDDGEQLPLDNPVEEEPLLESSGEQLENAAENHQENAGVAEQVVEEEGEQVADVDDSVNVECNKPEELHECEEEMANDTEVSPDNVEKCIEDGKQGGDGEDVVVSEPLPKPDEHVVEVVQEEKESNEVNLGEIPGENERSDECLALDTQEEIAPDQEVETELDQGQIPCTELDNEVSGDQVENNVGEVTEEVIKPGDAVDDKGEQNGDELVEEEIGFHAEQEPMEVEEDQTANLSLGDGVNGDVVEEDEELNEGVEPSTVPSITKSLPQCRLKRNYSCLHCGFNTQNPREHLYHLRDEHGERMKIFECPRCIYASKNQQKLIRHARMVHKLKIKRKDSSDSPHKKHAKPPRAKVSPSKSVRGSVSPGKSSRSSPGKSPKSSECNDAWDEEDDDDDLDDDESPLKDGEKRMYYCEQCEYSCRSRKLLNRHETTFHLKRRFFRCVKCNYVTHLKGRYTKHMKYHQLPILKCEFCDFRTPYRWNLDRHMKNHTEDCGEYKCHLCNFTAQIKQSLTVHISNHHLTPEQIREREMRRTIGISDPADCTSDDQEMEMMRLERDEHPDALRLPGFDYPDSPVAQDSHHNGNSFRVSNIDMGGTEDSQITAEDGKDEDGEPKRKKPKIKITLKKMKEPKQKDTFFQELNERHNFDEDFIHPDDVVHRHGNVYIKTFKCRFCSFKAAFKNEVSRHEKKIHSIPMPKSEAHLKKAKKLNKSSKSPKEHNDTLQQILQFPQHLKVNDESADSWSGREGSVDRENDAKERLNGKNNNNNDNEQGVSCHKSGDERSDYMTSSSKESSPSKDVGKKKNSSSFFDKLQEKISTSNVQNLVCQFCGHESKCLSESVRHQKLHLSAKNIYASASLSTRCQFCRHRCKTTDDLVNHLKLCPEARKNQIMDSGKRSSAGRFDGDDDANDSFQDDDQDDTTPDNEESANEDSKDEGTLDSLDDDKHPMENRVFVWNKFKVQEEGGGEGTSASKSKVESTDSDKEIKDSKDDIFDVPIKESSKSPVMMDYATLDYIESATPQGHHYYSKRVYRCPQCSFWATTASRFHVHIVGHFNKKPYNCSECGYKSNWRWDITKHIKLKTTRDSSHQKADVVITDSTGEKNYEKYDRYLTIIQLDETNAHRTEGGIPNRKGRPKRTPEKEEEPEVETPVTSPVRKPPMVTIPVMPRLQSLPRLTRAPGPSTSRPGPGPMPFGPILPGASMMVQIASSVAATTSTASTSARPPPPLSLRGTVPSKSNTPTTTTTTTSTTSKASSPVETTSSTPAPSAQYQIITPQGAVNTSLETLQLLASGSTNLSRLKKLQKDCVVRSEEKESQNPISHQMRLLAWLSFLADGAQHKVSVSSTGEDGREVAKMVLDHEGNPEWKCNTCDFRDSERETVVQHVRLAHARGGPVSLLHAVHRCDVCGYAAGTKRAVQLHIDSSHNGQGGITSRCEGQTPDPKDSTGDGDNVEHLDNAKTLKCRICPFSCKRRSDMRPHLAYHTPRADCIFKCMFCPYYVPSKVELFEHLNLHGMDVPASVLESVNKSSNSSSPALSSQDEGSRQFLCGACPFETRSRSKLMHHRQFHKPKGLPFKCPHCTYNVTRRHLLSQHIRVHGVDPGPEDGLESNENNIDDRSNSPSPSLTITPVNNVAAMGDKGQDSTFTDASLLPKLTDQTTMLLEDIPLVWVSRDNRFFKMFKCRHCPHVNLRKTNIQEHEKMHKPDAARESGGLHCPHCSYISVNAGVMSAHLKVHGGSMGQCHAIVDPALSDEDQLRVLTSKASSRPVPSPCPEPPANDRVHPGFGNEKVLYFCQQCPARFFLEKEIQIHSRFHSDSLPHHCDHCNFGARQQAHLLAHLKVHSPEYQQRTRTIMGQHRTATTHPPVPGLSLPMNSPIENNTSLKHIDKDDTSKRPFAASPPPNTNVMPQPPPTSMYMCDECPASFSKLLTLQYHQSLHGADNPHHCPRCSYAGKTHANLKNHLHLHYEFDENERAEKALREKADQIKAELASSSASTLTTTTTKTTMTTTTVDVSATGNPDTYKKSDKHKVEQLSKPHKHSKPEKDSSTHHPPIKLKLIGLRPVSSENGSGGPTQFKYYVEEQVPLSGVDLLRRKTEWEKEGHRKGVHEATQSGKSSTKKAPKEKEDSEVECDPKRVGDRNLHYPLHIDKVTGRSREKRYKCNKCPSAFEKTEQYHVHSNLHGSSYKYRCRICDYSVKFYANFMMHINRHKYHEKMVAQKAATPLPPDDDPKYEPLICQIENSGDTKGSKNKYEDKENLDDRDLTTTERQHLLLQNKKGVDLTKKDADKERVVHYCQYCPYANIRRDAVDSHSNRHLAHGGYGVYKCTLCDYTASQLNFIKEHTKVHFRPFKYVHPEGFMRHDRQEILSTPAFSPGAKQSDGQKTAEDGNQPIQEKFLIFSHDSGVYKPAIPVNSDEDIMDSQLVSGIKVNYRSGDVVDAPDDFVISLRPTKTKSTHKPMETSECVAIDTTVSGKTDTGELTDSQSVIESTKALENDELVNKDIQECQGTKAELASPDAMEIEASNSENPQNDDGNLTNGHVASEQQEVDLSTPKNDVVASNESTASNDVPVVAEEEEMEIDVESSENLPKLPVAKVWGSEHPEPLVSSH